MSQQESDPALQRAANDAVIESWREYMDLSVPLFVELGRTRLTVREILALEAQGIIQLSRSTGEGVEIIVDSRRLARGEILVIEDRTGIRVNEMIVEEDSR